MAPKPPHDDNPEWTEADFARARPASEVVGKAAAEALVRKGGRPPKPVEERKQQVTMRFAPDLLEAMRATGPGWQGRAEEILRLFFIDRPALDEMAADLGRQLRAAAIVRGETLAAEELQGNVMARDLAVSGMGPTMMMADLARGDLVNAGRLVEGSKVRGVLATDSSAAELIEKASRLGSLRVTSAIAKAVVASEENGRVTVRRAAKAAPKKRA